MSSFIRHFLMMVPFFLLSAHALDSTAFFSHWKKMISDDASLSDLMTFLNAYPDAPFSQKMKKILENKLEQEGNDAQIKAWFGKHSPVSVSGLSLAMRHGGKVDLMKAWWQKDVFSVQEQEQFLKEFGHFLSPKDHDARVQILLYQDNKDLIVGLLPLLSSQTRAEAKRSLNHETLYEQVKAAHDQKPRNSEKALALLKKNDPSEMRHPAYLGKFRVYYTRYLIERKRYQEALDIISRHHLKTGELYSDALWLKGWLLLRFLRRPKNAFDVFHRMEKTVKAPISIARATFWKGECLKAMKKSPKPAHLQASHFPSTFYGQVARSRLRQKPPKIFDKVDQKRASALLHKHFWLRVFLNIPKDEDPKIRDVFREKVSELIITDSLDLNTLLTMVRKQGLPHDAPWIYRLMRMKRNIPWVKGGYPDLPYDIKKGIDPKILPLVSCLILRESVFDPNALSSKDACGLMQLLESTAKQELKKRGDTASLKKSDLFKEEINVRIGTWHVMSLLEDFKGSMILSLAAYNAGKKPAITWVDQFGDPHDPKTNLLDWIETIPYGETRNYVQRILENIPAYNHVHDFEKMIRQPYKVL